ncbi:MAG: hypothetical protein V1750_04050 [Acidobacteriota bacterium]
MRQLGRGFFFTSLLAAGAGWAGEALPDPARVATLELEGSLAARPAVYLLLDPAERTLDIKIRGLVLETLALAGIEVVSQQPLLGGTPPSLPPLPDIWTVDSGPGDSDRDIIAPTSLRPYDPDEEDEDEVEPTPGPTATPAPTPTPVPEPPTSYRSRLSNGWDLWITDRLPPQGFWARLRVAIQDGWKRARGEGEQHRPAVTLALAPAGARKLNHLLRKGTPLLVAAGTP